MNDLVLVALLSSAGAAFVGISSALATIFGPAWRERDQRRAEAERAASDARYARALEFVDALSGVALDNYWQDTVQLHMTRTKFVSTLRAGEGAVERYCAEAIQWVNEGEGAKVQLQRADEVGDLVFGWLRGEYKIAEVQATLRVLTERHDTDRS